MSEPMDPFTQAQLSKKRALLALRQERPALALSHFEAALAQFKSLPNPPLEEIASLCCDAAPVWRSQGKTNRALSYYRTALESLEKFHDGKAHEDIAGLHFLIANIFTAIWKRLLAVQHFEKAYTIAKEALGEQHPNTQLIHQKLHLANMAMAID